MCYVSSSILSSLSTKFEVQACFESQLSASANMYFTQHAANHRDLNIRAQPGFLMTATDSHIASIRAPILHSVVHAVISVSLNKGHRKYLKINLLWC